MRNIMGVRYQKKKIFNKYSNYFYQVPTKSFNNKIIVNIKNLINASHNGNLSNLLLMHKIVELSQTLSTYLNFKLK